MRGVARHRHRSTPNNASEKYIPNFMGKIFWILLAQRGVAHSEF